MHARNDDADEGRPRALGRYALYEEIASGGIGSVCLARLRAEAGFSRIMAVKRLHAHHAKDPQFVAMFRDEARLAARVRHPNVVSILDVVSDADELFLVMEYVAGESLGRLMTTARERSLAIEPAIASAILCGVLEGLHAAHIATNEQGVPLAIVHRDVSPQNVLIGVDGVPRVVDFGVAKAVGRIQESTQTGQMKGKVAYMPPEQIAGRKDVDRRSDVWSASVVLWEMLAGRPLFGDALEALRFQGTSDAVPPPSAHGGPDVLDAVLAKGLAREMDERFQTAREMLVAVERAVPPAPARKVAQWMQKLARDALAKRATYVERIEREAARTSAIMATAAPRDPSADEAPVAAASVAPIAPPPPPITDAGLAHQAPIAPERPRRSVGMWGLLALLVGGLATATTLHPAIRARIVSSPRSPATAPETSSSLPLATAATSSEAAPSREPPPASASAEPTVAASASAPPPSASFAKRGRPRTRPPVRPTGATTSPTTTTAPPASERDPLDLKSRE
ncbi:MAG: serine/threonine protein kinase [Deltaproteobacteria bacterium]|nr:serine/threonine protein kinase [Deltaproteobacteria bacterium]